jgi:hypothetical protein
MELTIKVVIDDRLLIHYMISYGDVVYFIIYPFSINHKLIDYLRKRFGMSIEILEKQEYIIILSLYH